MRPLVLLVYMLAPLLLAEGPEFEVASIKPFEIARPTDAAAIAAAARMPPAGGGPGTADPTHIRINATRPKGIVQMAFDAKDFQVLNADAASDMFNYDVVVPAGASKDDVKMMWRNLLISRFGLKYHMEQREFQVEELTVGPRGHKLTDNIEPAPPPDEPNAGPPRITRDSDGRPVLQRPGMVTMSAVNGGAIVFRTTAKAQPVSALVTMLSNELGHPVIDKTGLMGKYDFYVEYTPSQTRGIGPGGAAPPAPVATAELGVDLVGAVQQQLGLRLSKGKGMLDVVVVDKIERTPTEN